MARLNVDSQATIEKDPVRTLSALLDRLDVALYDVDSTRRLRKSAFERTKVGGVRILPTPLQKLS